MTIRSRRYEGPRPARPGETRALLAFLDRIFVRGCPGGMAREYPHLYGDMEAHRDWSHVMTRDGRIVAHTGIYPLDFVVRGRTVRAGGIGAVATDERHRGKGLMSALLGYATAWMRVHGMPLSILWGDRYRYARFGWEGAGTTVGFTLYPAAASFLKDHDEPVTELKRPAARVRELHALHRALPARVERSATVFPLILSKVGRRVFAVLRRGRVTAYAITRSWRTGRGRGAGVTWQVEEAVGAPAGVVSIFRALVVRPGTERVRGELLPEFLAHARGLLNGADCWSLSARCLGQVKVVDRNATLAALGVPALAGPLRAVRPTPLELPRLLFGPVPLRAQVPAGPARTRLERVLPLPLFLWPTDHV